MRAVANKNCCRSKEKKSITIIVLFINVDKSEEYNLLFSINKHHHIYKKNLKII